MKYTIDAIAIAGGLAVTGGVYQLFGLGWSLISAGTLMIALAVTAARVNGGANAADG